jgi:PncC family amidohydrolase
MQIKFPFETIDNIRDKLITSRQTMAIAESVTSGLLQAAMSQASDARMFFQGGFTLYNVPQKCRQLGIEPIHALDQNGVSPRVAGEMASGVARSFCSQFGIGVVGYAAPVPEKHVERPFAYYAICEEGRLLDTARIEGHIAHPLDNQLHYVTEILHALLRLLS